MNISQVLRRSAWVLLAGLVAIVAVVVYSLVLMVLSGLLPSDLPAPVAITVGYIVMFVRWFAFSALLLIATGALRELNRALVWVLASEALLRLVTSIAPLFGGWPSGFGGSFAYDFASAGGALYASASALGAAASLIAIRLYLSRRKSREDSSAQANGCSVELPAHA